MGGAGEGTPLHEKLVEQQQVIARTQPCHLGRVFPIICWAPSAHPKFSSVDPGGCTLNISHSTGTSQEGNGILFSLFKGTLSLKRPPSGSWD